MRSLVVTNHKGGTAKTTTAVNLAAAIGELGRLVLVLDLDPQASATRWLGGPPTDEGLRDVLAGRATLADIVCETSAPGVVLAPSSGWLVASEPAQETDIALGLMRAMERLPPLWDYLIVDCPPSTGYLSIAPLAVCQEALVPVEAHVLALAGLASLIGTMDRVRERLNRELSLSSIVACRVNRTAHAREVVDHLRRRFGPIVLDTVVRENSRLAEAPSFRLPITRYAPTSKGADDYRALAKELLARHRSSEERQALPFNLARFAQVFRAGSASRTMWQPATAEAPAERLGGEPNGHPSD
jgi:chromosome partitioning protein